MSAVNRLKTFCTSFVFNARLIHARLKKGTVRFKITDLDGFYKQLNQADIAYVILRWLDDVPMTFEMEQRNEHDVDHLVADHQIKTILKIAAPRPGRAKCDFYSASGQSGTTYNGMPYYMPFHAQRILSRRIKDERGFFRPCLEDEFFSFAYHLCYHKGHRCGIPTGLDAPYDKNPPRDYKAQLLHMAESAGFPLSKDITLIQLHDFLFENAWSMSNDLMLRWPDQHSFLKALIAREEQKVKAAIADAEHLTVFILRDDCDTAQLQQVATKMITERFNIIQEIALDNETRNRIMSRTRGGNWVEKYRPQPVEPITAIICRNSDKPGPLPISMSASKLSKRYPHLKNTDILIKRVIRDHINQIAPLDHDRVVIHATDNSLETVETLQAILGDKMDSFLKANRKSP